MSDRSSLYALYIPHGGIKVKRFLHQPGPFGLMMPIKWGRLISTVVGQVEPQLSALGPGGDAWDPGHGGRCRRKHHWVRGIPCHPGHSPRRCRADGRRAGGVWLPHSPWLLRAPPAIAAARALPVHADQGGVVAGTVVRFNLAVAGCNRESLQRVRDTPGAAHESRRAAMEAGRCWASSDGSSARASCGAPAANRRG